MKRSWFGLILLLALLAGSLYCSRTMDRVHRQVERELLRSARFAQHGDWEQASLSFRQAKDIWQSWEFFRSALADHTPAEEVDADLAAAETYCAARDRVTFAAACRALARQTAAIGQAHTLTLRNLL